MIDGPQSVVWDEAENRLHAQKGILAWCLGLRRAAPTAPTARALPHPLRRAPRTRGSSPRDCRAAPSPARRRRQVGEGRGEGLVGSDPDTFWAYLDPESGSRLYTTRLSRPVVLPNIRSSTPPLVGALAASS